MSHKRTRVLLVEDNPGDARPVREMLAEASRAQFGLDTVARIAAAALRLLRSITLLHKAGNLCFCHVIHAVTGKCASPEKVGESKCESKDGSLSAALGEMP